MATKKITLGPFLGPLTSIDPSTPEFPSERAADCLNVRLEDGKLNPRYGYSQLEAPQTGFTAVYGYDYLEGYADVAGVPTQLAEFVSFENLGVAPRPYHRTAGGATVQEITISGTSVSLHASTWRMVSWKDIAYMFNPNDTTGVYRYTIGTYNSLLALNKAAAPTTALTYSITKGGPTSQYSQVAFTGINVSTGVAYTGLAHATDSVVNSDGSIIIGHQIGDGPASFTIDLTAPGPGAQNWTYNDNFAFKLHVAQTTGVFQIDASSVQISVLTTGGAEIFPMTTKIRDVQVGGNEGDVFVYKVDFYDKTRSDFASIKKIRLSYNVIHHDITNADNNIVQLFPWWVGGITVLPNADAAGSTKKMSFAYSYTNTVGETGIGGRLDIPFEVLRGYDPFGIPGDQPELGVHLRLTATTGSVTSWTLYVLDITSNPQTWMQVANTAIATLTYDYKLCYAEALRLTPYNPQQFTASRVVGAFAFKGWMIWLYRQGTENLRHSAVGSPERQYSSLDTLIGGPNNQGDETRGATYTMADNAGDSPLAGFQCGDAAMYVGSVGVYAQIGDKPWALTASKKLPGSFGCPNGFACCEWRDANGNPGVVALSRTGEGIYFYAVGQDFDGQRGYQITELSADIRPSIRSFLGTDFSNARLCIQKDQDALWLIVGRKAMVLRRPHALTGQRYWEFYQYTMPSQTISYPAFTALYGAKWMRSNGATDFAERDSSLAVITGATRDNGAAMPTPYWQSKRFTTDAVTRIDSVDIDRDTLTNTPTVQCISRRQTTSKTWGSGSRKARFGFLQKGTEHQFKVSLGQNDDAYHRIIIDVTGPHGRRPLS